jgi:hypothetical protein
MQALSMGQGQEEAARSMLLDGLQKGQWVMLQNCHLSGFNFTTQLLIVLHILIYFTTETSTEYIVLVGQKSYH